MRKVLVIGLGGSGGKTLSFMMDELLADLKATYKWTKPDLPKCWKFVHIDVPLEAEQLGGKLTKPVADVPGGHYIGLAGATTKYPAYDSETFAKFEKSGDGNGSGLRAFARWRPEPLSYANITISGGAGAYRAVGRVVTLARAEKIYDQLKAIVEDLYKGDADGVELAEKTTGNGGNYSTNLSPLILIVSSMAGGSGSSMVLDVADMLNGMSSDIPGFEGGESAAFLYTSEVFKNIPEVKRTGGAGTLATISEIISAATRSEEPWTKQEWDALVSGKTTPSSATSLGRGPKLTFPIGGTTAGRAFGTDAEDVYRGFARMLTPLLIDESQQTNFFAHVVTNFPKSVKTTPDVLGLGSKVGSDGARRPVFFGGFGSSTLSVGRERYKEFSAQRIARRAVDILVEGFRTQNSAGGDPLVMQNEAADAFYSKFLQIVNIDGLGSGVSPINRQSLIDAIVKNAATIKVEADKETAKYENVFRDNGAKAAAGVESRWRDNKASRDAVSLELATGAVDAWSKGLLTAVETAYIAALSQSGIEVANKVIDKFASDLRRLADELNSSDDPSNQARMAFGTFVKNFGAVKGAVNWAGEVTNFAIRIKAVFEGLVKQQSQNLVFGVVNEMVAQVLPAIQATGSKLLAELKSELKEAAPTVSSAAYREAPLSIWPQTAAVPGHFEPAINEVLLTPTSEYSKNFDAHIMSATNQMAPDSAVTEAARRLILRFSALPTDGRLPDVFKDWSDSDISNYGSHPHLIRNVDWSPAKLAKTAGSLPSYELRLGTSNLRVFANEWLGMTGSAFEVYCRETIRDWMAKDPSNETLLATKLQTAIGYAAPLVSIDAALAKELHGTTVATTNYEFSNLPLEEESNVIRTIINGMGTDVMNAENVKNLKGACKPAVNPPKITINGTTAPISPWALSSLTAPIRENFALMKSSGAQADFWRAVRARSLPKFIPVGEDIINAILRGYMIGRLTGRVINVDPTTSTPLTVQVWVQSANGGSGEWKAFSADILGAKQLGMAASGGQDTSGWNVPAILLESLPLALANIRANDLSTVEPYLELLRMGKNLKSGNYGSIFANQFSELDDWYNGTGNFSSQLGFAKNVGEEAKAGAITWLEGVIAHMDAIWKARLVDGPQFYEATAASELAPNFIAAAKELLQELNRAEPKLGQISGEPQMSNPVVPPAPVASAADVPAAPEA